MLPLLNLGFLGPSRESTFLREQTIDAFVPSSHMALQTRLVKHWSPIKQFGTLDIWAHLVSGPTASPQPRFHADRAHAASRCSLIGERKPSPMVRRSTLFLRARLSQVKTERRKKDYKRWKDGGKSGRWKIEQGDLKEKDTKSSDAEAVARTMQTKTTSGEGKKRLQTIN